MTENKLTTSHLIGLYEAVSSSNAEYKRHQAADKTLNESYADLWNSIPHILRPVTTGESYMLLWDDERGVKHIRDPKLVEAAIRAFAKNAAEDKKAADTLEAEVAEVKKLEAALHEYIAFKESQAKAK